MADTPAPQLPSDLRAALDVVTRHVTDAHLLVTCGRLGLGERGYLATFARLRELPDPLPVIERVKHELIVTANPNALFGSSCAHIAGLEFFQSVWMECSFAAPTRPTTPERRTVSGT